MTDPSLPPAAYSLRHRGPWTVVSLDEWGRFSLGQTTAVDRSCDPGFQDVSRRNQFFSLFSVRTVHEADQVHGAGLADVPAYSSGQLQCDGLTAARSSVMLTMRTADCYPVYLKDVRDNRFGIVHAGWRGLRDRIVHEALTEWFDGPVNVLVGAGISADRYEVSEEVISGILETHDLTRSALEDRAILSGRYLNLPGLIHWQCQQSPRPVHSFQKLPLSTGEDRPIPMYSYRETSTDGRMVSWIYKVMD